MAKPHHVIYLPGLGDFRTYGQQTVLKTWKRHGLRAQYQPLAWGDGEDFSPKLQRVVKKIDELHAQGHVVSLVGVSAGASAAINAYIDRKDKVKAIILICGKVKNIRNVNSSYFQKNPAFKQSLLVSEANLGKLGPVDKAKIFNVISKVDHTVPSADSLIEGVKTKVVPAFGHISGIFVTLVFYSSAIINFLKKA